MIPDELRAHLATLGWSQRELARELGTDERTARRWAAGATIPHYVAVWLAALAEEWRAVRARHPVPRVE